MTGRDDELLPEGVPAFDDPAYADLRAELADLGDVGPVPADVAARLDDVLADLRGAPAAEPLGDAPVPLRRHAGAGRRLLAAAAAVVVVGGGGIGLANVVRDGTSGADKAERPASAAQDTAGMDAPSAPAAGNDDSESTEQRRGLDFTSYAMSVPQLTTAGFAEETGALLRDHAALLRNNSLSRTPGAESLGATPGKSTNDTLTGPSAQADEPSAVAPQPEQGSADRDTVKDLSDAVTLLDSCAVGRISGGVARPILLDSSPAILVIYPAVAGSRLVQARSCDANTVLISATVPVG